MVPLTQLTQIEINEFIQRMLERGLSARTGLIHASLLSAQGTTLHELKEILGHSQIPLTVDPYDHAYIDAKRDVIGKMDSSQ